MRVLLTVPSLDRSFGGPAGKARHLGAALESAGPTVRIVTVGRHAEPGTTGLPRAGAFRGTPLPASVAPLRAAVVGADLVHVLGYRDPVGTVAALVSRRVGVPYVLEPLGMHRRRIRSRLLKAAFDGTVGQLVLGGASAVIATSRLEADELVRDGVEDGLVVVRANGVETGDLLPLPPRGRLRLRLGIPDDAPLVLALGRITAKKGLADLVRAAGSLDGAWLLVAGPDQGDGTLPTLRRLRSACSASERIKLLPSGLWGRNKARAMADADVFALPSRTENFGTAAAEAACCGLPVVVSSACGVREWLDPGSSRIVEPGRVPQLRSTLRDLLDDRGSPEHARMVAPALQRRLGWDRLARRQLRIYSSVLNSGDRPDPRGRTQGPDRTGPGGRRHDHGRPPGQAGPWSRQREDP